MNVTPPRNNASPAPLMNPTRPDQDNGIKISAQVFISHEKDFTQMVRKVSAVSAS